MSTPDVRVRLQPEGIKAVLAGLRKVQTEGKKAQKQSEQGLLSLGKAGASLKKLLPTLGIAAAVAGVVALGRSALRTADSMGKLAQVTGAGVENLSAFANLAETNAATNEEIRVSLVRLAEQLRALRNGNSAVAASFAELGLKAEDFNNLDTVEVAEKVAKALATIEDPARKAALAKATLGEAGARLLPTLKDLADIGLKGAHDRAEELGLIISSQLVADTTAANDAMGDLSRQVKGTALAFVGELAPFITQAMTTVSEQTEGKGVSAIRTFGRVVGRTINAVINIFRLLGGIVTTQFDLIGTTIGAISAAVIAAIKGNFTEAKTILKEGFSDLREIAAQGDKDIAANLEKLVNDLVSDPPKADVKPTIAIEGETIIAADKALTKARLEEAKARSAAELALQKERIAAEEAANQRGFDQNLISLQQFIDKRLELLKRSAAIEIAALELQSAAIAASVDTTSVGPTADAERLRARQQIATLENQIAVRRLALAREIADLEGERFTSSRDLADEQAATAASLAELEGRRHDAFIANLEKEIRELRELGIRAGQTAEEIDAIVGQLTAARTTRFNFEEAARAGSEALQAFARDAQQIRLDQESGLITQFTGELRLIELQRERLQVLMELADAGLAAAQATGDPALIAQAQAYSDSIRQIEASFLAATDATIALKNAGLEAFEEGLADLLSNIQDIESLEDAFKSLARTVAATLQKIAAEIIARQAVFALLRAFGGGGGGTAAAVATGFTGGYIRGYAGGGDIAGPTLPIPGPDKIPILAAQGEFMMKRSAVAEPGALSFLRAWNSGRFTLKQAMAMPRFEAGGLVGGGAQIGEREDSGGGGGKNIRMVNVVDPQLALAALDTASGEEVILNIIEKNADKLKQF